ncbi:MAG: hypothetical protein ABIS30_08795 [Gallionella sp.]|jgi:PIN domain nuclease of toxin-antitoxin system
MLTPSTGVNHRSASLGQQQIDTIETAESLAISAMTCWGMAWLVMHGRIALKLPLSPAGLITSKHAWELFRYHEARVWLLLAKHREAITLSG